MYLPCGGREGHDACGAGAGWVGAERLGEAGPVPASGIFVRGRRPWGRGTCGPVQGRALSQPEVRPLTTHSLWERGQWVCVNSVQWAQPEGLVNVISPPPPKIGDA